MQYAVTAPALSDIEAAVLECLVYADLFDSPLTLDEVHRWLAVPATFDQVQAALTGDRLAGLTSRRATYVMLRGREQTLSVRERRQRRSKALARHASLYGRVIGRLPFVRMVAVTGSLAVDNADAGDDIDYLVVTAPGRVWLSRTMIMAVGRLARLRGVTLCPNYVLAESAMALPELSYYTARELTQMRVLTGRTTYERMLAMNDWWREYLPNAPLLPAPSRPSALSDVEGSERGRARSLARRVAEAVLDLPPFDALERWVYARKGAELRAQSGAAEVTFDETMCKGHFDRWQERTQQRLRERLRQVLEGAP